jgi:hypothetical protein
MYESGGCQARISAGAVYRALGHPVVVLPMVGGLSLLRSAARGHIPGTSGSGLEDGELMVSRQAFVVASVCAVFFLFLGVSGLFWPHRIQNYALKHSTGPLQRVNPFLPWMRTRQYIWSLRVIGLMSMSAAMLLFVILVQTFRTGRVGQP